MAKTILVTGGLGYIGSHSVLDLSKAGYNIVIVDNLANSTMASLKQLNSISNKEFTFYNVDLTDMSASRKVFESHQIDGVIHFAALKAVGESQANPMKYYHNNVLSTVNLLTLCNEFKVHHLIFSSTACVYGENPKCTETDPLNPDNVYGRTKYYGENIIADNCAANKAFSGVVLRYFNVIGNNEEGLLGDNPNGIPDNLLPYIQKVAIGKLPKLTIFGQDYDTKDGTCLRDYIHVVDLVEAHRIALEKSFAKDIHGFSVFNIGTGSACSVTELVQTFIAENKLETFNYVYGPRRDGDVAVSSAVVDKAEQVLGWKAKYSIKDMVRHSWMFIQKYPNGYE